MWYLAAATYDGSIVIGHNSADGEAWIWDGNGYVQPIGKLPGYDRRTYPLDISDDGSVVVGGGAAGFAQQASRFRA